MSPPADSEARDVVYQRAGVNWSLLVRATSDRLYGFMDLIPVEEMGRPPNVEEVEEALRPARMTLVDDFPERLLERLESRIEGLAGIRRIEGLLIAEGFPSGQGKPADVRWFVQWERTKGVSVADDQVDYRDTGHIVQVKEGDPILEIVPPTRGAAGVDIFGEAIPGLLGDPLKLEFGENVVYDEASNVLRAAIAGEVRRTALKVWVDSVYRVEADVDFNVGNIDFTGNVQVGGNVLDGFVVRARGTIKVYGSVLAATLEAGGDILIGEGATGRGQGTLQAGGYILAKYLNGMNVRAGGDLKVTNEISNCATKVGGKVVIERGSVVGGELVALRGLETRSIGTAITQPTVVRIGVDPETDGRRQGILDRLKTVNQQIERIFLNLKPYVEDPRKVAGLPPSRRDLVRQSLVELAGLKAERESHEQDLKGLEAKHVPPEDLFVNFTKAIYAKSTVQIGTCAQHYDVELYGPMTLVPDESTGRLKPR